MSYFPFQEAIFQQGWTLLRPITVNKNKPQVRILLEYSNVRASLTDHILPAHETIQYLHDSTITPSNHDPISLGVYVMHQRLNVPLVFTLTLPPQRR